jgi:hypothetical protein
MTQEEKELLIIDLCGRLPYGVVVEIEDIKYVLQPNDISDIMQYVITIKPYLFPISSMTDEQRKEFLNIQSEERKILFDALVKYRYEKEDKIPIIPSQKHVDWLTKNNFDYRGLIPMGLANDATGLNIY